MNNEDEQLNLGPKVPMIDATSTQFKDAFAFNIWSTQSCSDYRNDRERPYNGQPWTDDGVRGQQEVHGLTMRDLKDCLIKAMLMSAHDEEYLRANEFLKCWDFSMCKNDGDEPIPTEYLLEKQKEGKYISTKVDTGNWRPQDVYKLDWNNIDPLAVAQNFTCNIEKMMGIFPNTDVKISIKGGNLDGL
jgi:hypothetical protein